MTVEKFPCKRHTDRYSSRKCFQCREYICSSCQTIYSHHIFCSIWCFFKFLLSHKRPQYKLSKEFISLLVLFVLIQCVSYFFLRKEIHSKITAMRDATKSTFITRKSESSQMGFTLDTALVHASHYINISGKALNNTIIGLWQNGNFVSSTISRSGKYEFPLRSLLLGKNSFVLWGLFEDGTSTLIDTFSIDYFSRRLITLAQSVERLQTDQRVLALTFDAGSTSNGSDSIISILRKQDLRATFFLTGLFIEKFPHVVGDLINDGHELANHTYTHPHLTSWELNQANIKLEYVDRNFIYSQLNKTDSILYAHFKRHLKPLWRAPFGEYNDEILTWAAELGYRHIKWSNQCDTWDWVSDKESPLYRTPNEIYAHLINLLVNEKLNGAIILMHFGSNRENEFPFEMLTKLIHALKEENYKILTVSQLLALNRQV